MSNLENTDPPSPPSGLSREETEARWSKANRELARRSPAGLAEVATESRWKRFPHSALIDHHLLRASRGECRRLIVMMPPQHGKSTLTSEYFPAWFLGMNPDKRVILASYEADFAASWGRKVRDILEEHGQAFFGVSVSSASSAANRWDIEGRDGGMMTAGIGGPVTGKKADLLIIDDPVKNAEEALSETIQKRNYDWYLSTALTRVSEHGIIVIIQTRWAEEDLAGKLIKDMETKGEKFELVSLPAIAIEDEVWPTGWERKKGEPLCPGLFSLATLQSRQRAMSDYLWSSLYQQSPLPLGGSIFKRSYFRPWKKSDRQPGQLSIGDGLYHFDPAACLRYLTIDSAMKEDEVGAKKAEDPDYTVIGVWASFSIPQGPVLVLLDLIRDRMQVPDIVDKIKEVKDKWDPAFIGIESVGGGLATFQCAKRAGLKVREISTRKGDDVLIPIEGNKTARAMMATDLMHNGRFYVPEFATWLPDYFKELLSFPLSAHDDQVDATAYAIAIAEKLTGSLPENPIDDEEKRYTTGDDGVNRSADDDAEAESHSPWDAIRVNRP